MKNLVDFPSVINNSMHKPVIQDNKKGLPSPPTMTIRRRSVMLVIVFFFALYTIGKDKRFIAETTTSFLKNETFEIGTNGSKGMPTASFPVTRNQTVESFPVENVTEKVLTPPPLLEEKDAADEKKHQEAGDQLSLSALSSPVNASTLPVALPVVVATNETGKPLARLDHHADEELQLLNERDDTTSTMYPPGCQMKQQQDVHRTSMPANAAYSTTHDFISNATMDFVALVSNGSITTTTRNPVAPETLLSASHQFEPIVVGQEFLHFGGAANNQTGQMQFLGRKLALGKERIKVVWFGGSNTHGRSKNPFAKQVQGLIEEQYILPSGQHHEFINQADGGRTCCSFATSFNTFMLSVKGADLVFLEHAVNDGILGLNERRSCLESLILRIWAVAPQATLVPLCLKHVEGHDEIIQHYNLPQVYLGAIATQMPAIRGDEIHLNDLGSFFVRQAVATLLQEAERVYCTTGGASIHDDESKYPLPPRLYAPADNYDWRFGFDIKGQGLVIHDEGELQAACADIITNSTNTNFSAAKVHSCISAVSSLPNNKDKNNDMIIPCEGCPDTQYKKIDHAGAGWVWCGSPWPALCKPNGVHHHHCSSRNTTGVYVQEFTADNLASDNKTASSLPRQLNLGIRVLKGYDVDFGEAIVMAWVKESSSSPVVVNRIDTRWKTHATVLADSVLTPSLVVPPPTEHARFTIVVIVIPLGLQQEEGRNETLFTTIEPPKCRLYVHSLLASIS